MATASFVILSCVYLGSRGGEGSEGTEGAEEARIQYRNLSGFQEIFKIANVGKVLTDSQGDK